MSTDKPEVWLRGPVSGMPALLLPVAHALLQAREEITKLMDHFPEELLWEKPAGLASPGFHLQHISGVINRLFTYAGGEQISLQQLEYLALEGKPIKGDDSVIILLKRIDEQVEDALSQLTETGEAKLKEIRTVGRAQLPSTVIGLYVHAAEHTMRHVGQLLVTVNVLYANYLKGNDR